MALLDTDILAVWRESAQANYKTTVQEVVARVPNPQAPTLTAVLDTNNVSQGLSIIIEDAPSGGGKVIELSSNLTGESLFNNNCRFSKDVLMGAATTATLTSTGAFLGVEAGLLGNSTGGVALSVYSASDTLSTITAGTATATVTITNTGAATFAGAVEADSISGGVYA
jgi:hypothetical protein